MRRLLLSLPLLALSACDTGSDRPPTRAQIVGISVEDAPLRLPDGSRWDGEAGGGPEIYFRIYDAGDVPDASESCRGSFDLLNPRDDANAIARFSDQPWYGDVETGDFPLIWNVSGFELRPLDRPLTIVICDYDPTTTDDEMGISRTFTLGENDPIVTPGGREDRLVIEGEGADRDRILVRLRLVYR